MIKFFYDKFGSWEKIRKNYVKFKMRSNRGNSFPGLNEIKGVITGISTGGILVLLIDKYFNYLLPLWLLIGLYVVQKIMDYLFGKLDEKKLKVWQEENEYNMRIVTPFNQELMAKIDKISEKLNV